MDQKNEPIVKEQVPQATEPQVEVKNEINTPEKKEEEFKPLEIPQEDWKVSPLFYEVANFFNIEPKLYEKAAEKLSLITDWAIEQANSNKLHDILPVIRQLEDKITQPAWGETRYGNLYRYLRLAVKRDSFNKALGSMERVPDKNNG
jgi:hypothetical protein